MRKLCLCLAILGLLATGGQVFAAVRQALGRGSLSTDRWIGFVPSTAALPLTFIAADGDRPVCQLRLSLVEKRQ